MTSLPGIQIVSLTWPYILAGLLLILCVKIWKELRTSPLSKVPGPASYAITKWRLAYDDWTGKRTRKINSLHERYGPVVRISENEVSFNSLSALKLIYGAGSGFGRHSFYRMFDVYGYQNLFTFHSSKLHGNRKKLLAHAYSKTSMLRGPVAAMIERHVGTYMSRLSKLEEKSTEKGGVQQEDEIFRSLHYYSLDNITSFVYGESYGATHAVLGNKKDQALLNDILDPARRKLAWFGTHLPRYTKWLMTRTGLAEKMVVTLGLLPQSKPTVYTGIRLHGMASYLKFKAASEDEKAKMLELDGGSIMARLWAYHESQNDKSALKDGEIASECADHLLAGIDTTSDSLMFLIWALSLPKNEAFQDKLIAEISSLPRSAFNDAGVSRAEVVDKLPYLDAVIKETLRLYAPLPASEPRTSDKDYVIDGYHIPAGTVVSMSPFSLHRNGSVFKEPLVFNPERWLGDEEEVADMKRWWWAFSSGGRMCIGLHLAMAEMTTLTTAIYREYRTSVPPGKELVSPGITSRFEVFTDDTMPEHKEHECMIQFTRL